MTSPLHEGAVALFRANPRVAAILFQRVTGIEIAYDDATDSPGEYTLPGPKTYRPDATSLFTKGRTVIQVILSEVQLAFDKQKIPERWPFYVSAETLHRHAATALLVVTPTTALADRYRDRLQPKARRGVLPQPVLCPLDQYAPPVTDLVEARALPDLTLLSALFHARDPAPAQAVAPAVRTAARVLDYTAHQAHYDVAWAAMSPQLLHEVRQLMSEHEYHFEFFAKLAEAEKRARSEAKVEGKVEGKAESILMLLDGRRVRMPARIRERILGCTDLDQLDHWFRAAITARTIDDLFPRKTPAAA